MMWTRRWCKGLPADFNELNSFGKIEIEFDENIKIKTPNEKVIITPPQPEIMPVIRSIVMAVVLKSELRVPPIQSISPMPSWTITREPPGELCLFFLYR